MTDYDLAVIGAGPAGLAAAVAAAAAGLRVALIDGSRQLGGQYYRHPPMGFGVRHVERLHHGWDDFARLEKRCQALRADGLIDHLGDHHVWAVEGEFQVHATVGHGTSRAAATVRSQALLLATGSYERQIPFPGWDLPGVFTAGGAQALLKGDLVLAGRRVVVAGTGPLLMPVAAGLSAAGAEVLGLFEANGFAGYAKRPCVLVANTGKLIEAAGYAARLARGRVPVRTRHAVIAAHGTDSLESVTVARVDASGRALAGSVGRIACDALAVGYGLVPQIDLGLELGLANRILGDGTVALVVDGGQRTSRRRVWAAGESVGVAGAQTALLEGEIAGHAVAAALRHVGSPSAAALKRRRDRQRAFADVVREQHPVPAAWRTWLVPDTTVCRCEEVPASAITEAVDELGAADLRTVKLLTRAGMGWCQGRMCGYAVACLAGGPSDKPSDADLLAAAKRPLSRPVLLGLLAQDPQDSPVPQDSTKED